MPNGLPGPPSRPYWISWPLLVWLAGLVVLAAGNTALYDPDTYWHTAAGRWILVHHQIPSTDPFSHSMPGTAWVAHEWLSEVIFAMIHQAAGWDGLVVVTALCFATTLALSTRFLLRHLEPVHALMLVALAAGMLRSHLLARPHILVAPLLVLWLAILLRAREQDATPTLWALPLITLWANLHGSFTLGLALVVALGAEASLAAGRDGWRRAALGWGGFLTLATIASMITPFHVQALLFTGQVLRMEKAMAFIGEWQSPNFQMFSVFEIWLLALLAAALLGRLRLPLLRLLMIVGLVHLSLRHGRYMAVTGIVTPLLMAEAFAASWYSAEKVGKDVATLDRYFLLLARPASALAVAATAAITVLIIGGVLLSHPFQPDKRITPSNALAALRAADVAGPIFNSYAFGGYLIHEGVKVFIDGRADMYGDGLLTRYVDAINLKSDKSVIDLLNEYQIEATMLAAETPAVALLDHLPGWRRLYGDDVAVVHVRVRDAKSLSALPH